MFILTFQIPTSYHNFFSTLIDSLDPIHPYLDSSQPTYPTHIVLLTVTHFYITLHCHFYSTHVNLYNLLLAQVHRRYRVLDAEVIGLRFRREGRRGRRGRRRRRGCGTGGIMTGM